MKQFMPWLILLMACGVRSPAQDSTGYTKKTTWNGYIKNLTGILTGNPEQGTRGIQLLHNRINIKTRLNDAFSARLEIRNRIFYGGLITAAPGFSKSIDQYPGYVDLSITWVDRQQWVAHSVIDRLLLQYQTDRWDIKAGRQRINWGINTIWNPNDLFNAYNFLDFDYEERPGNDAVRLQRFFSNNRSLELAWRPGRHQDETIAALLWKFNQRGYDVQLLAGIYQSDWVLGGGWAGALGNTGFKGELSYFHPRRHFTDTSGSLSVSLMADRTFSGNWYLSASLLYNGSPGAAGNTTAGIFSQPLSARSLFPARWAFYFGASKTLSPVTSLQWTTVYGNEQHLLILAPAFTWNAARNLDTDCIIQSFFASETSHYRHQASAGYLRLRWSF